MLKKIILPLVLLIFTQQELYGMKGKDLKVYEQSNIKKEEDPTKIWETINNWVNRDESNNNNKYYPNLWWLWAFLDNVPFQYGNSKIWNHGEAYYGLSNGIGFFPSALNFGWLKVGIGDAHINVINLFLDYIKNFIQCKTNGIPEIINYLAPPIFANLFFNIHIISVKILNCIKIKLIAPLTLIIKMLKVVIGDRGNKDSTAWYITYNTNAQISWWYGLFSPRIEINISGIIDYFKGK